MATKKSMAKRPVNDFISFILAAEKDEKLTSEFLSKKNAEDLYRFFKTKGFTGIPEGDCQDILTARTRWEKLHIPPGWGKPPCDGPKKGY
jgi:hypothetical protein